MKLLILTLTFFLGIAVLQGKDLKEEIIGKWRPVDKKYTFTWEIQKDGVLIIKGDNGKVLAGHWEIIEPDLFAITGLPNPCPPEKLRFEDGKLILVDAAKGTDRVSIRLQE